MESGSWAKARSYGIIESSVGAGFSLRLESKSRAKARSYGNIELRAEARSYAED